jgi:hypothetical protein
MLMSDIRAIPVNWRPDALHLIEGTACSELATLPAVSWIATLDAKAQTWPPAARWAYRGLKWYLILAGVILVTLTLAERLGLWHR